MAWGSEASSVNKIIVIQGQWPELDPHSPKTQKQKQQQKKIQIQWLTLILQLRW